MNSYEKKQARRRERLERRAGVARANAEAMFDASHKILDQIPAGQPILVGHHSERRHRRDIDRSNRQSRRGLEELEKAKGLQRRADAVGTGGVSSDDPDAIDKLKAQLESARKAHEMAKRINKAYRAARKRGLSSDEAIDAIARDSSSDLDLDFTTAESIKRRMALCPHLDVPLFTVNSAANLRRLEKRIADLEKSRETLAKAAETADDPTRVGEKTYRWGAVYTDTVEGRVCIELSRRVEKDLFREIKGFGFVWSRERQRFQRKPSNRATWAVERVVERMEGAV